MPMMWKVWTQSGDRRWPENKNEKEEKEKKVECKNRKFEGIFYQCGQKGHIGKDCRVQKNGHYKKFEKAERAIDRDRDKLVLCSLMSECKTKRIEKKVWFAEDVKQPTEAVMMCTINSDTSFCLQRIPGSEILVHHAILPTMMKVCMTSLTLTNQSQVALVLCPLQRRASYK